MNLTFNQKIAIVAVIIGVMTTSAAQLTDLFGPQIAKHIVSASAILQTILSGVLAVVTGQSNVLRDVQAMPGVEKIVVNEQANRTLATLAVDEAQPKIEAKPSAEAAVERTAHQA